jgi:GNAT superfamily N-acetyltransferase
MPTIDGPRLVRPEEFSEVLELVDRCFSREQSGMAARLPFCYDETHLEYHAVVCRNGSVVAHAGAIPQTLAVDGGEVGCRGISGVATDPRYRGNGYMSDLLEFWLDHIDEPLMDLGGDRQRYGHFGWENAGREVRYRVTERSLQSSPDVSVRHYTGDAADLDTLCDIHAEEPYRVVRSRKTSRQVYSRRGTETLRTTDEQPAYVSFNRETRDPQIVEWGGSADGVVGLLAYVFQWFDASSLTVVAPPSHQLTPALRKGSESWQVTPMRMLNIRDLPTLLSGFEAELTRQWETYQGMGAGDLTLGITGDEDTARLRYDDGITVDRTDATPDIALDRREMTHLLFGSPACEIRSNPVLNAVTPLNYYIWPSERV